MEKSDVDLLLNFKRFLYVYNENNKFIAGDPFAHGYFETEKLKSLKELSEAGRIDDIVQVMQKADLDLYLPQKAPLLFALAMCVRTENTKLKTAAYDLVKKTCKSIEDILLFLKFYKSLSTNKGFGSGFKRCINNWYLKLKPIELAEAVTKYRSRHGWSHKNLFEMTRPKTDEEPKAAVLKYVMHGYKDFESSYENNVVVRPIFDFIKRVEQFKHCEDPNESGKMIAKYKLTVEYFPAHLVKCSELWEAAIPSIPLKEILTVLPRLQNYGLLKYQSGLLQKIIEILNDNSVITNSGIHPVEVMILLYNYTSGGKFPDFKKVEYLKTRDTAQQQKDSESTADETNSNTPTTGTSSPTKSTATTKSTTTTKSTASTTTTVTNIEQKSKYKANNNVTTALHKVLNGSFKNVKPTNLRYMITVDARDHMKEERCFKCGNVTAMKAAVLIALYLVKTEKDVVVAVFNDQGVVQVNIDKNMTMNQAEHCILEVKSGHVQFQKPFEWAQVKKKKIDVFINVFHSPKVYVMMPKEMRCAAVNIRGSLESYRKKMRMHHVKIISICLCKHNYSSSSNMIPGMLDICGFSDDVPKIIEAFARDSFK